jgi:hypothetical protein
MTEAFVSRRRDSAARIAAERPRLEIVVFEAKGLAPKGWHESSSDPYVKVRLLDSEKQILGKKSWYHYLKTKAVKKSLNPVFKKRGTQEPGCVFGPQQHFTKEHFTHEMFSALRFIQFEVWHEDFFSDAFMGQAVLTVGNSGCDVNYSTKLEKELTLGPRTGSADVVSGSLSVSVWLRSPENLYQEQIHSAMGRERTASVAFQGPMLAPSEVEAETIEWDARFLRQMTLFKAWSGLEEAVANGGKVFRGSYENPRTGDNASCELTMHALAEGGVGLLAELQAFGVSLPVTVRIMELPLDPKAQQGGTNSALLKLVALAKGFSLVGTYAPNEDDIHGTYSYVREGEAVLTGSMEITCRNTESKQETKTSTEQKGVSSLSEVSRAALAKLAEGVNFSGHVRIDRAGNLNETYHVQVPKQALPTTMGSAGMAIRATHYSLNPTTFMMYITDGEGNKGVRVEYTEQGLTFSGTLNPNCTALAGSIARGDTKVGEFDLKASS